MYVHWSSLYHIAPQIYLALGGSWQSKWSEKSIPGSIMQVQVGAIQPHAKARNLIVDFKVDGFIWLHTYDKLICGSIKVRSKAAFVQVARYMPELYPYLRPAMHLKLKDTFPSFLNSGIGAEDLNPNPFQYNKPTIFNYRTNPGKQRILLGTVDLTI
jgi:hypothetical protein